MSNYILTTGGELYHYGVKGMKWGVRRYQNKDGTLTAVGKTRLYTDDERRNMYDRAKRSARVSGNPNTLVIDNNEDIKSAASFLKKQVTVLEDNFNKYADSRLADLEGLETNPKFLDAMKKRLNSDFGGPDKVDDPEYVEMVSWDEAYDLIQSGAFDSSRTRGARQKLNESVEQYRSNLKAITDDIVGSYGDQPVSHIKKGGIFVSGRKTTSSYLDAVANTLYDEGGGTRARHLLKGDQEVDIGEHLDYIVQASVEAWMKTKK